MARRKKRHNKQKATVDAGLRSKAHMDAQMHSARRGVVPGAEAEQCPVCITPSEGWYIEGGKRTWYHFGRSFPCVENYAHIAAAGGGDAAG